LKFYHEDFIQLYGFTQDPSTLDYMIVMSYAEYGSLKKNLSKIVKDIWLKKLIYLYTIVNGLNVMHQEKMIHCDFHHGNILKTSIGIVLSINDLGLCKPIESIPKKNEIYGVLPFVAPEVLRGKSYTPASDIYSFSMIMWEFTSGILPFNDRAHDLQLALSICKGERPEIIKNTPKCYIDLMEKCWNKEPLKRPSALDIKNTIKNWYKNIYNRNIFNEDISKKEIDNILEFYKADTTLKEQPNILHTSQSHSQAYHTSRLLDFTIKLNEILNQKNKNKNNQTAEVSQSIGNIFNISNIKF